MTLLTKIDQDFIQALKAKDAERLSVLRMLKTAFQNAVIDKRGKTNDLKASLTDEEAIAVIKRQVKQLEEAREMFASGGRPELAAQNEAEVAILKVYLPAQVSEETVRAAVQNVLAGLGQAGPSDFGKVMAAVMKELKGQADGTVVSKIVKELLGG
ncbi:GatB/YqeY domain-containing protein [Candidatus Uhrbacteria bacterium]|nr:GatB/YqeY domain-containing protein [Candidatus Uhrbacteria bacterium]